MGTIVGFNRKYINLSFVWCPYFYRAGAVTYYWNNGRVALCGNQVTKLHKVFKWHSTSNWVICHNVITFIRRGLWKSPAVKSSNVLAICWTIHVKSVCSPTLIDSVITSSRAPVSKHWFSLCHRTISLAAAAFAHVSRYLPHLCRNRSTAYGGELYGDHIQKKQLLLKSLRHKYDRDECSRLIGIWIVHNWYTPLVRLLHRFS